LNEILWGRREQREEIQKREMKNRIKSGREIKQFFVKYNKRLS